MPHPWEDEAGRIGEPCPICEDDPDAPDECPGHDDDGPDPDRGYKEDRDERA